MKNNYDYYNNLLINNFPNLKNEFEEYTSWQDGINTGCTLVYEDIFVPYIIKQLINDNQNEINKISEFIEYLINLEDEYAFNIVYIAVLETLKSNANGHKIQKYLKEKSLKEYNNLIF